MQVTRRSQTASKPPAVRLGRPRAERLAHLEEAERQLYLWILGCLAGGELPTQGALQRQALSLGLREEDTLARLAEADLVQHDPTNGEIVAAYPFSGRPTTHRVLLDLDREVYAMCAVDALGIAFLLACPVEVLSRDPMEGSEIWVRVEPGEGSWWEPKSAVVLWGASGEAGSSAVSCCPFVHFFASGEQARRYLTEHASLRAEVLSLPEAIELAKEIFGGVFPSEAPAYSPDSDRQSHG